MNIDWVSISVIASVIAMIVGVALFARTVIRKINSDHSED